MNSKTKNHSLFPKMSTEFLMGALHSFVVLVVLPFIIFHCVGDCYIEMPTSPIKVTAKVIGKNFTPERLVPSERGMVATIPAYYSVNMLAAPIGEVSVNDKSVYNSNAKELKISVTPVYGKYFWESTSRFIRYDTKIL
jgi:hypothetical protein